MGEKRTLAGLSKELAEMKDQFGPKITDLQNSIDKFSKLQSSLRKCEALHLDQHFYVDNTELIRRDGEKIRGVFCFKYIGHLGSEPMLVLAERSNCPGKKYTVYYVGCNRTAFKDEHFFDEYKNALMHFISEVSKHGGTE